MYTLRYSKRFSHLSDRSFELGLRPYHKRSTILKAQAYRIYHAFNNFYAVALIILVVMILFVLKVQTYKI